MLTIQEERYADVIREAKPLLMKHWHEVALYKEQIALLPDFQRYERADALGLLLIMTMREDGRLVGYAVYVTDQNLHYSQAKFGLSDIFWLDPEMRRPRAAVRLFLAVEEALKARSVDVMVTRTKIAHPAAGRLLLALGHEAVETSFQKLLSA